MPAAKDGKGSISKVGLDGKIINRDWVTGLNAPKGLGLYKNTLWVNNIDELVAIDIKTGTITQRVKIEGAKFLNDLTISKKGVIYTSDSDMKKVFQVKDGNVSTYLENFRRPNGVLAIGKDLYILDSGKLLKANSDKQLTTIAEGMLGSTDGIERVSATEFIVSSWGGAVYHVQTNGTVHQLLDTQALKINLADIGYDAKKRIIYVPTFNKHTVVAYELR
ncbi:MAG: ATP/GTP-binding protein [Saprospiraceae bacterium]|nr:ATP/GTP-binding protein [Saprospiraceae bacterium]